MLKLLHKEESTLKGSIAKGNSLHLSILCNDKAIFKAVIDKLTKQNEPEAFNKLSENTSMSPLSQLIRKRPNDTDSISHLVENVNVQVGKLEMRAAMQSNRKEIMEMLLKSKELESSLGEELLENAFQQKKFQSVKALLESQKHLEVKEDHIKYIWMGMDGELAVLVFLRRNKLSRIYDKDQSGNTLLHYAVEKDNRDILSHLLKNDNIDKDKLTGTTDTHLKTPLLLALEMKRPIATNLLLEQTKPDHFLEADSQGNTPLKQSIANNDQKVFESILSHDIVARTFIDEILNFTSDGPMDLLLHVIVQDGSQAMFKDFKKRVLDDTSVSSEKRFAFLDCKETARGNTLLHLAAQRNHKEVILDLLQMGAKVNQTNNQGHYFLEGKSSLKKADVKFIEKAMDDKIVIKQELLTPMSTPVLQAHIDKNQEEIAASLEALVQNTSKSRTEETWLLVALTGMVDSKRDDELFEKWEQVATMNAELLDKLSGTVDSQGRSCLHLAASLDWNIPGLDNLLKDLVMSSHSIRDYRSQGLLCYGDMEGQTILHCSTSARAKVWTEFTIEKLHPVFLPDDIHKREDLTNCIEEVIQDLVKNSRESKLDLVIASCY